MDSLSSGSMSSSGGGGGGGGCGGGGGDEEYDSRGDSISSFLNHPSSGHFGSISNPQPPLLSHPTATFFNPHSQNQLDVFQQSLATQNANVHYDQNEMVWPRPGLRSEANYGSFGNLKASSSSSPLSLSSSLLGGVQGGINTQPQLAGSSQSVDHHHHHHQQQQQAQPNVAAKNPKKRTRASRRAPTTVLTTDTTNFRQMVQEFTGIPTAPFSAASPYSRRFDLFSTAGSAMRAGQLDTLGSLYPLRPSPQKVQLASSSSSTSPSLFNSSVINAAVPPNHNNATGANSSITTSNAISCSSTNSFQVPTNLGLLKQVPPPSQNMMNMQNQLLNFQPLLQTASLPPSLKLPLVTEPFLSSRAQASTSMPSLDDQLGLSRGQVNANLCGFSDQASSDQARQATRNEDNIARWREGGGGAGTINNGGSGGGGGGGGGGQEQQQQQHLGSFDGNDNHGSAHHLSSFKLNSSSSSDFNPEKVLDNASSGGVEFTNYN